MRIGVLGTPDSWYFSDLSRAGRERQHVVSSLTFHDMHSRLREGRVEIGSGEVSWNDLDGVIVRSMPAGSLEQVIVRMDMLGQYQRQGRLVLNPPRSLEAAIDKYLTTARLTTIGLPTPATIACQTAEDAEQAFAELGGDVVVKPLFGGEGRGITRVSDPELAQRAFKMLAQLGAVIYLQPFVVHQGYDVRALVIGEKVWAIRRRNESDWRTNISRGGKAERHELTAGETELALAAARAVGAPLAGVDLLPAQDGQCYVLEVNAVPGWRALSKALEIDVAAHVIELFEESIEQ